MLHYRVVVPVGGASGLLLLRVIAPMEGPELEPSQSVPVVLVLLSQLVVLLLQTP